MSGRRQLKARRSGAVAAAAAPAPRDDASDDDKADADGADGAGEDNVVVVQPFDGIRALCLSETLADVHFVVGSGAATERIPAHRLVLSSGNALFRAMLYPLTVAADGKTATYSAAPLPAFPAFPAVTPATGAAGGAPGGLSTDVKGSGAGVAQGTGDEVVIPDVSPAAFKKMLTAIYTDELEVTADDVTELIALAKRFQVETLKALCVEFMEQDVTAEKACALFVDGRKLLNEPAFGLAFIEDNIEDVVKTDGFAALPRDCLEAILRSAKLSIDEGELWASVDRWAAAECKRRGLKDDGPSKREALGSALHLVRFPLIEMQDLCLKVQPSGVLNQDELLSLFTYAAAPESAKAAVVSNLKFVTRERDGGGGSNKVQVHDFKWSAKLSNGARVRCDGDKLTSIAPTCNRDVLGIADTKGWSRGVHFWRIQTSSGGCYRRVGVVDGEFDRSRYGDGGPNNQQPAVLGSTPNSWGVNIASAHAFGEPNVYSGAAGRFGSGEVGVLLDLNKKRLHVYSNGQFIATAFSNVKGKKVRPAVQICHSGCFCSVLPARGTQAPVVPK